MSGIVLLVAVLICPLIMGTAMLLMWREMRRGHSPPPASEAPSPPEKQSESQGRDGAHARHA